jgi:hypothetical protein
MRVLRGFSWLASACDGCRSGCEVFATFGVWADIDDVDPVSVEQALLGSFEIVFAYPLRVGVFSNNGRRVVRSGSVGAEVLALLAEVTQHLKEHVIRFCVEARRLRHFYTLGFCLQFKCWTSLIANMMHEVRQYADELLDLSNEHGFPLWAAGATFYRVSRCRPSERETKV